MPPPLAFCEITVAFLTDFSTPTNSVDSKCKQTLIGLLYDFFTTSVRYDMFSWIERIAASTSVVRQNLWLRYDDVSEPGWLVPVQSILCIFMPPPTSRCVVSIVFGSWVRAYSRASCEHDFLPASGRNFTKLWLTRQMNWLALKVEGSKSRSQQGQFQWVIAEASTSTPHRLVYFFYFFVGWFLRATAYMLLRAYAIAIPSVRPSVTRVIHAKTVVVRIVQFSPYSSPIPLVFVR